MKKARVAILTILGILIAICTFLSIAYGFYSVTANIKTDLDVATSLPSCIGLTLEDEAKTLSISGDYAVPLRDEQVLNSPEEQLKNFKYTFSVKNDCTEEKKFTIGLVPFEGSTMVMEDLKYVVVENKETETGTGTELTGQTAKNVTTTKVAVPENIKSYLELKYNKSLKNDNESYSLESQTLEANATKKYDLYVWIGYDANGNNNETMDKNLNATVVVYETAEANMESLD